MCAQKITAIGTTGTFGFLLVKKLFFDENYENDKLQEIKKMEMWILGIASGQYLITWRLPNKRLQRWRYLDWIVTTPLLLKTFHTLAEAKGFTGSFGIPVIANILMVVSGYISEFLVKTEKEKQLWYLIGLSALAIVLFYVFKWNQYLINEGVDTRFLANFFYIGWILYGANFLVKSESNKQINYNILDFINKGVYSLHLDSVIRNNNF